MHAAVTASISSDLFTVTVPLLEKVLRTVAVYVGILALLRVSGKRDLAQLNTFDLVVLLLLSNVVQNAVIGNDVSLLGGLIGAATLMLVNSFMVRVGAAGWWTGRPRPGGHTDDPRARREDPGRGAQPARAARRRRRGGAAPSGRPVAATTCRRPCSSPAAASS